MNEDTMGVRIERRDMSVPGRPSYATCVLCEAMCGIAVTTADGKAVRIEGDREDPLSRGHVCPKAVALEDVRLDPDRVRAPLVRQGGELRPADWATAMAEAGRALAAVRDGHGRDAVAVYFGNPMAHNGHALLGAGVLLGVLRTRSRFSATSADQLPHMLAALEMFGHQALLPVPDVDRAELFLCIGANPLVSNGSLMTAPGIERRLTELRARGGRLIVIDPRRTETARMADEHHFIRPGSDALLLMAMVRTLFEEDLAAPGHLAGLLRGVAELKRAAEPFTPERVAARTGIAAGDVRRLTRELARSPRAVVYGRVGVCQQEFGALSAWLLVALSAVTGNLDRPGGVMFTTPPVDVVRLGALLGQRGSFGRYRSRVRGLPEFGGELPVACLAEEIEAGNVRALVTLAGNPVASAPNGGRLGRALAKLDAMVAVDLYRNETTRHAHVLLPTTFGLEREHFDLLLQALAVRNTARWSRAIFEPPPGVRDDWTILTDLACEVAAGSRTLEESGPERTRGSRTLEESGPERTRGSRTLEESGPERTRGSRTLEESGPQHKRRSRTLASILARTARALGPQRIIDAALRAGPHRLSVRELERHPHGLDLGPLEPRLPALLHTADRRIHVAPARFLDDVSRLRASMDVAPRGGELLLVGRRNVRSNNSWMHNSLRLVKGRDACTLLMHPTDASARGIATGARVRLRSRVGEVRVRVEVTNDIAPGVVSLPHGWGHSGAGVELRIAREHPGVSINDVTDDARVDPLSGNAAFSGTPVAVEPDT
jgi:anaerobic selenocysteine-containing dehydrogenase